MPRRTKHTLSGGVSVLKEAHIKWFAEDKKLVEALEHSARTSNRYFNHHVKHIIQKAFEAGLVDVNGR